MQKSINTTKKAVRVDKSRLRELRDLRAARWYAKRLGDALEWLVFLFDRKSLFALAANNRTPISATSEDDGSRGIALATQNLLDQKWGLPIMHDITDCLRIGDISILSFGKSVDDRRVRTIEVKTTRTALEPQPDGSDLLRLQVPMTAPEPFRDAGVDPGPTELPPAGASERPKRRDDRRLDKQMELMELMERAIQHRDVGDDVTTGEKVRRT